MVVFVGPQETGILGPHSSLVSGIMGIDDHTLEENFTMARLVKLPGVRSAPATDLPDLSPALDAMRESGLQIGAVMASDVDGHLYRLDPPRWRRVYTDAENEARAAGFETPGEDEEGGEEKPVRRGRAKVTEEVGAAEGE